MIPSWCEGFWKLGQVSFVVIGGAIVASSIECVNAQAIPDGTLGVTMNLSKVGLLNLPRGLANFR